MAKAAVTLETMKSHNHIVGDIEHGVKLFTRGGIEFMEDTVFFDTQGYIADIPVKNETVRVLLSFSKDKRDIKSFICNKCTGSTDAVCRHVVAATLAVQGGIIETKLTLGKTASASTVVTDGNTAKAVGSGNLDVFATPMMIALMERAASDCIADALEDGETSVGTQIAVEHTAASAIGAKITATATVEKVFGRKVEFTIKAEDEVGEIGKGKHTRVITNGERLLANAITRVK